MTVTPDHKTSPIPAWYGINKGLPKDEIFNNVEESDPRYFGMYLGVVANDSRTNENRWDRDEFWTTKIVKQVNDTDATPIQPSGSWELEVTRKDGIKWLCGFARVGLRKEYWHKPVPGKIISSYRVWKLD